MLLFEVEDLLYGGVDLHLFLLSLTHVLALAASFYTFYPRVWKVVVGQKKWWYLLLFIPLGIAVFILSRLVLQEVVVKWITGVGNYRDPWQWGYVWDNIYRPMPIILFSWVAWLINRQNQLKADQERLATEKTKAELAFLRSQVNPHFLFNSLGFIQSRIFKADPEAADMVLQLSSILRKSFEQSENKSSTIQSEMEMINDLTGIMKKRFPNRIHLDIRIDDQVLGQMIEPLILVGFAENMFKHGDLRQQDEPGQVIINLDGEYVLISFRNKIMKGEAHVGSGIGLENTRKRLDLVYGDQYTLEFGEENGYFNLLLKLPFHR